MFFRPYVLKPLDLVNTIVVKNLNLVKISLLTDVLPYKKHQFSAPFILVNLGAVDLS